MSHKKEWEIRLEKMSEEEKQYLVIGIEDGFIVPDDDALHIFYRLTGVDEHPILTFINRLKSLFVK